MAKVFKPGRRDSSETLAVEGASEDQLSALVINRAAAALGERARRKPDVAAELAELPPLPEKLAAAVRQHPEMAGSLTQLLGSSKGASVNREPTPPNGRKPNGLNGGSDDPSEVATHVASGRTETPSA